MRIKSIPTIMTEEEEVVLEFKDIVQQNSQENNENNNNNEIDQREFYEVEAILQKKYQNKDILYLVRWKGYTESTWEPHSSLQNCAQLVDEFELKLQQKAIENIKRKQIRKSKIEQRNYGSFQNGDQVSGFSQFGRIIQIDGEAQQQLKVHWKNRKHGKPKSSWISLKELHKRAPGKLIQFYESHSSIQGLFKNQEVDSNESTL